jgi:hypothetical protein
VRGGPGREAQLVPVTIGRDYGTSVEILAGIQPTDQVIVAPSDSLTSGTRVRIAGRTAAANRDARLAGLAALIVLALGGCYGRPQTT